MALIGDDIDFATTLLESDRLVGIPTETVYGLAGNALSENAILEIYRTKERPKFDPLIAHTNSIEKVEALVNTMPKKAIQLAEKFWPGPLTLLLDKSDVVPDLLTSGLPRVAVRIPDHKLTLDLLERLSFPLAAPSANPFGYVSPVEASHVNDQLGEMIEYILDGGRCDVGIESTIVGFEGDEIVLHRLGGKSVEEIEELVGPVRIDTNNSSNPVAPGMLKMHYSPGKRLLIGNIEQNASECENKRIGIISFEDDYTYLSDKNFILSESGDLDEAARNLFKALREMDVPSVDVILTEFVPNIGLGHAINDRLRRASA